MATLRRCACLTDAANISRAESAYQCESYQEHCVFSTALAFALVITYLTNPTVSLPPIDKGGAVLIAFALQEMRSQKRKESDPYDDC